MALKSVLRAPGGGPSLWVDASVVFRGLKEEDPGGEWKYAKERGSQCKRMSEERREHGKGSREPRGQSRVGMWRLPG